jgi:hypothetical protein
MSLALYFAGKLSLIIEHCLHLEFLVERTQRKVQYESFAFTSGNPGLVHVCENSIQLRHGHYHDIIKLIYMQGL